MLSYNYMTIPGLTQLGFVRKYKVTHDNLIRQYLEDLEAEVLRQIPRPFGTFDKASYSLHADHKMSNASPLYFYTTTIHTEDEIIEKLKNMFLSTHHFIKYYTIYKLQDGIERIIDTNHKLLKAV